MSENIFFTSNVLTGKGLFEYNPQHHLLFIRKYEYNYRVLPRSNFKGIRRNTYIDTQSLFGYKPYFYGVKVDGYLYKEHPTSLDNARVIAQRLLYQASAKPFYVRGRRGRIEEVHFSKQFADNDIDNLQLTVTVEDKSVIISLSE